MFPKEYENRSIISDNCNEWRDEENCGVFQFPEDFFVSGIEYDIPENKEGKGKEFYGGKNKDKYLVCTWKNGKKNGEGLLYNQFGEVLFRGTFVDDNLEGEGYIYDDGVVIYKFFYQNNKRDQSVCICYSESSILMKEFSPEGNLIYCGGFNSDYQREGYGAEYTQGFLSSYGLYENNVVNLRIKTFSNGIMREYNKANDEEVIYIGEYKDSIEEGFPREGEGREYADSCLLFHGLYKNNQRHGKGTLFFSYGIARLKGIWKEGICIEEHEIDNCGFYREVKYDGRSINSIHINNDRIILNSNVIHFRIHSLMCNGEEIRKLVLKNMERIETISIGNKCFSNVRYFEVYNLPSLLSIEIGQDSFTNCDRLDNKPVDNNSKDTCIENNSKCTIANCSCLMDIKIGEGSFSSFCEFNLKNLPSLESLRIGVSHLDPIPPDNASYCFYWATRFSLQDFPSLSIVEIGSGSFHNANVCLLEKLPCLTSFTAGSSSFGGVCDCRSKQVTRFCDVPSLTLVSFGSKAFYYFHELIVSDIVNYDYFLLGDESFYCIQTVTSHPKSIKKFKKLFKDHPRCSFKEIE